MQISIGQHIKLKNKLSTFVRLTPNESTAYPVIHSFGRAYYHRDDNLWELPLEAFKIILSTFKGDVEIFGELPDECEAFLDLLDEYDKPDLPYESKTTPFEHQVISFKYSKSHNKFLLGDEQGLGKTKQALDIAYSRRNKFQHCLIVCGVNGLKYNWQQEISVHTNAEGYILGTRVNKKGKEYIGSMKDRLFDLQNLQLINSFFLITNVETLRDKDIQKEMTKLTEQGIIGMTIIDEIHKCKNSTSSQGKAIHCLHSYYKMALTGTPLMNDAIDLYNILKWLEIENHTLTQFKSYHCELGGFGGYEIVGYRHLDELQSTLDSVMLRRRKDDVLDLPPKIYTNELIEMNDEQWKVYREIHSQLLDDIDKIMLSPNPLVELIRLRQATGYPGILSTKVTESAKLNRMVEIVDEVAARGSKCIVFSNWTSVIDPAVEMLQHHNPAVVTSYTKDPQSEQAKFKRDAGCKVIIGTIGVLGTGFTLTQADTVIFLDEPWNMATKLQAEDRAHRIGTNSSVNIITLLCKDTIDERIHQLITDKGELSDLVVDKINKEKINFLLNNEE